MILWIFKEAVWLGTGQVENLEKAKITQKIKIQTNKF